MIYVFEEGNVVYDGDTISDDEKSQAVAVEKLPTPQKVIGKKAVIKANLATQEVYYQYVDDFTEFEDGEIHPDEKEPDGESPNITADQIVALVEVETAELWYRNMVMEGQLKDENASLWYKNMLLEGKSNHEIASVWYEVMKGGQPS